MHGGIIQVTLEQPFDWVSLIVSTVIPIGIMVITLLVTKAQQKTALKQQATEHADAMKKQEELNTLSILPFMNLETFVDVTIPKPGSNGLSGTIGIDLIFKNIGLGTAISLAVECIPCEIDPFAVGETNDNVYVLYKKFIDSKSVAQVNDTVNLQFIRRMKNIESSSVYQEQFLFTIKFSDMKDNRYKQQFIVDLFVNDEDFGILSTNLYSCSPILEIENKEVTTNETTI